MIEVKYRKQILEEQRIRKAGWSPAVFGMWTKGNECLPPDAILKRIDDERKEAKASLAERKKRKAIWENVAGCECASTLAKRDRCNVQAVRCNARLARIQNDLKEAGLKP